MEWQIFHLELELNALNKEVGDKPGKEAISFNTICKILAMGIEQQVLMTDMVDIIQTNTYVRASIHDSTVIA